MRYTLKIRDFLKAALLAIITPVLYVVQDSLAKGELTLHWKEIAIAAVSGFVAYLIKNFFTDDVKVAKKIVEKHEEKVRLQEEKSDGEDGSKPPEEERPDKP